MLEDFIYTIIDWDQTDDTYYPVIIAESGSELFDFHFCTITKKEKPLAINNLREYKKITFETLTNKKDLEIFGYKYQYALRYDYLLTFLKLENPDQFDQLLNLALDYHYGCLLLDSEVNESKYNKYICFPENSEFFCPKYIFLLTKEPIAYITFNRIDGQDNQLLNETDEEYMTRLGKVGYCGIAIKPDRGSDREEYQ